MPLSFIFDGYCQLNLIKLRKFVNEFLSEGRANPINVHLNCMYFKDSRSLIQKYVEKGQGKAKGSSDDEDGDDDNTKADRKSEKVLLFSTGGSQ